MPHTVWSLIRGVLNLLSFDQRIGCDRSIFCPAYIIIADRRLFRSGIPGSPDVSGARYRPSLFGYRRDRKFTETTTGSGRMTTQKSCEFLSRPEIWQRFSPIKPMRFCGSCDPCAAGLLLLRRVSAPRLNITERHGCVASYRHSLMQLKFDTSSGLITGRMRFHDKETPTVYPFPETMSSFRLPAACYASNPAQRFNRAAHTEQSERVLQLQHSATLDFTFLWKRIRLGEITYTYTIDARSMLIDVQVALDLDPGIQVSDVILTIGHGLSHRYFQKYCYRQANGDDPHIHCSRSEAGSDG